MHFTYVILNKNIRKWINENVDSAEKYCPLNLETLKEILQSSKSLMSIQTLGLSWLTLDSIIQNIHMEVCTHKRQGKIYAKI